LSRKKSLYQILASNTARSETGVWDISPNDRISDVQLGRYGFRLNLVVESEFCPGRDVPKREKANSSVAVDDPFLKYRKNIFIT